MTDADTLLAIGVGGALILIPDPATTTAGAAIVASQLADSDIASSLVGN